MSQDARSANEKSLSGSVAIVTGGARGIGLAIARALLKNGARVLVVDNGAAIDGRSRDESALPQALASLGDGAAGLDADVADPTTAARAVKEALERFGVLDVVVNNAAILRDAFIFKANPDDFEAVIAANLAGAYRLMAAAAPVLRENAKQNRLGAPYSRGRILNIVSSAGFYGNFGQSAYAAAKAGLMGLTRIAAHDLARSGITANAVMPFAATRVTDSIVPGNEAQAQYKARALKVSPDHVGRLAAFLAGPAAQRYTGQLFGVRGRQIFVFSQPRPVHTVIAPAGDWAPGDIADALAKLPAGAYADLVTDLEAFNTEPVI